MTDPIKDAEALSRSGRHDEARELLLAAGFIDAEDAAVQAAYSEMIAPTKELAAKLRGGLRSMLEGADGKRKEAARSLEAELLKSFQKSVERWARDPRTHDALSRALDDKATHEHAAVALSRSTTMYFADRRTARRMIPVLASRSKVARQWAIDAVAAVGGDEVWLALLPLANDRTANVRAAVGRAITRRCARGPWAGVQRDEALRVAARLLDDEAVDVRECAVGALSHLRVDAAVRAVLEGRLEREDNPIVRDLLESALRSSPGERSGA